MPKLTISAGATGTIVATGTSPVGAKARKHLAFSLISGDAYWGWTPTVTAAGATDAGIPMSIGSPVTMSLDALDFDAPVNIFSAAGCVVNYQELKR